ncbi:hypothetical protein CSQ85_12085 [Bifidobacterium rousetti]|uniref:hypothetical protein n=1 Tax=Bifidobacterium rousetti TaxID=2045439 RepID=UPI0012393F09|nr:hypothetical protein [Bifidobacterium rousetti]KAA8816157.1 hypothetical protein CSQ85_12085 [Bifidobacterium rousetti]
MNNNAIITRDDVLRTIRTTPIDIQDLRDDILDFLHDDVDDYDVYAIAEEVRDRLYELDPEAVLDSRLVRRNVISDDDADDDDYFACDHVLDLDDFPDPDGNVLAEIVYRHPDAAID